MTEMYMKRSYHVELVTIPTGTALSNAFDFRGYAIMQVTPLDALTNSPEIAFYVASDENATFRPLNDEDGSLVEITGVAEDVSQSAPSDIAGVGWVQLWTENAGSDEDQTGAKEFLVEMKS